MSFELPPLPYEKTALSPHISEETINYHYGKHHQAYVTNLNNFAAKDAAIAGKSLEELVLTTSGPVFNNAAQVWNHTFYWHSLSPSGGGQPSGKLAAAINAAFGSFDEFKARFTAAAAGQFGSGWAWLVADESGALSIVTTANAACPLTQGLKPLLTCDVWEHAYYVDYRNNRAAYIAAWWSLVNWDFAASNLG
jgi:Fe-Mn family superoxide dismutase